MQNGSPFAVAYNRLLAYTAANDYRFAAFGRETSAETGNFRFDGLRPALAEYRSRGLPPESGALRLAFVVSPRRGAVGAAGAALPGWSVGVFAATHLFVSDPGIDTFGPVHYHELALPLVVLSALGARRLAAVGRRLRDSSAAPRPRGRARSGLRSSRRRDRLLAGRAPRARPASRPTSTCRATPSRRPASTVPWSSRRVPFAPPCRSEPTGHFVFFRPNNDPDLRNPVLWVNHLTLAEDRELMARFPTGGAT